MARLKRIVLAIFIFQVILVITLVRKQFLKTTENNSKVTISRRQYLIEDKTSKTIEETSSNKLSISLDHDRIKHKMEIPISKDTAVKLKTAGIKLAKRSNPKTGSADFKGNNGQRIVISHENILIKTSAAIDKDNDSTDKNELPRPMSNTTSAPTSNEEEMKVQLGSSSQEFHLITSNERWDKMRSNSENAGNANSRYGWKLSFKHLKNRKDILVDKVPVGPTIHLNDMAGARSSNTRKKKDKNRTVDSVTNIEHGFSSSQIREKTSDSTNDTNQADFLRNWCRVQKARTDWRSILRPCENNTVWGRNTLDHQPPSSAKTSFITKWDIKPVGSYSRFVVQSMSENNETKSIGGDSWRVHLRGPATIAPTVFDHNNGTYEMLFLVMERGKYQVDMWLDYTLCNGFKDPPPHWFRSGNVQGKNQPDGILKGDKPFLIQKFRPHEPTPTFEVKEDPSGFKPFQGRADCACPSLHWDGLGRWVGRTWKPYLQEKVQVRNHNQSKGNLIFFGDSLSNHFQESIIKGPYQEICYKTFESCRRFYNWVYDMEGYWGPEHTEPGADGKDYDHDRVLRDARKALYSPMMDANSVLFLNWGIHFTAVTTFNKYQRLIQEFATIIKHGETDPKTGEFRKLKGQFFWKTTTAINRHRFPYPHKDVRRFLTFPRVLLFNAFATSIMCQSNIDVIDVYPISDAYPKGTQSELDPVHYANEVFRDVERLLFETFDDGVH